MGLENGFPPQILTSDGMGGFAIKTTASIIGDVTIIGTGLATEVKQDAEIALLTTIDSTLSTSFDIPLSDVAQQSTLLLIKTDTTDLVLDIAAILVNQTDGTQKTQIVDAANVEIGTLLVEANGDYTTNGTITYRLKEINDRLTSIDNLTLSTFDTSLSTLAKETGGNLDSIDATLNTGGALFTEIQSINTSTSTLTGIDYALGATQTNGNQKTQIVDNLNNEIGSVLQGYLDIIQGVITTNGSAIPTSSQLIGGSDGISIQPIKVDGDGVLLNNDEVLTSTLNVLINNLTYLGLSSVLNNTAKPDSSLQIGGSDGTNLQPIKVETDGTVNVIGARGILSNGTTNTIVAANVSQTTLAANSTRKYILIQNISDTDMYINFGAAATIGSDSILLTANGGFYERGEGFIPNEEVFIICSIISKNYTVKEA